MMFKRKIINGISVFLFTCFSAIFTISTHAVLSQGEPALVESKDSSGMVADAESPAPSFNQLINALPSADYDEKSLLLSQLMQLEDERILSLFTLLLNGDLQYVKKSNAVVTVIKQEKLFLATDYLSNELLGEFKKRKLKKIGINNNLRRELKNYIAELQIFSKQVNIRHQAALDLLKSADQDSYGLLTKAIANEDDGSVLKILGTAKALVDLHNENEQVRIDALLSLERSLYPEVRVGLNAYLQRSQDATLGYSQKEIELASKTLSQIEELIQLNGLIENIYFGIALGAVLLLAAIGLAITFGVMGVINMAHGEMIMLGAYTTYVIQQLMPNHVGLSLVVAIPAAFLVSGLVGVLIERGVIRHLYGRPLETLLATFGISLVLQQAVRSIFGPLNQDVVTPEWMAGTFSVNPGLDLTFNRLYIIIFSLLVLAGLALVLKKTLFGLQMRAVTMDRPMASSMGIKTGWVDALTFGLGSGIAGVAGVALSQLTNVGPNLGQAYIIDSFMVVVFGGVGNLWGTLVGAMSLGIANKVFEPMAGAVLAKILVLVAIILFIQKRPRGLFALKGRAVED